MADSFTPNLNLRKPEVGAANDTWGGAAGLNHDLDLLDALFAPDGSGTPVGLNIGTGKVLNALAGMVEVSAFRFLLADASDATKVAKFDVSLLTPAVGATMVVPAMTGNHTLVFEDLTQTLSSKTLDATCLGTTNGTATDATAQVATDAFVQAAIAAALAAAPSWLTGDVRPTYRQTSATGWLMLDDSTIGDASSGAAHTGSTYQALYNVLWAVPGTTVQLSDGSATAKGATAAADWSAQKRLVLAKVLGRVFGVAGAGAGLTARTLGTTLGEETHLLTTAEMPTHKHTMGGQVRTFNNGGGQTGGGSVMWDQGILLETDNAGGGTAHNVMQPTAWVNAEIKL